MQVTDAMIEAGARGIVEDMRKYDGGKPYDEMNETAKNEAREVAKACLLAALSTIEGNEVKP